MPKIKDKYPELDKIEKNTVKLSKHIKKDAVAKAEEVKDMVSDQANQLAETGQDTLKQVETKVKEKPLQALGIAFAAGLALSVLLGRR